MFFCKSSSANSLPDATADGSACIDDLLPSNAKLLPK